jgi:hypothetical protein
MEAKLDRDGKNYVATCPCGETVQMPARQRRATITRCRCGRGYRLTVEENGPGRSFERLEGEPDDPS